MRWKGVGGPGEPLIKQTEDTWETAAAEQAEWLEDKDWKEGPDHPMNNINSMLPVEMLEVVFLLLPRRALLAVLLVCRRWRAVGESPRLWAASRLRVTTKNLGYVQEVLASRRCPASA